MGSMIIAAALVLGVMAFIALTELNKADKEYKKNEVKVNETIREIKDYSDELKRISEEFDSLTRNPLLASVILEEDIDKNDLKAYFMYIERLGLLTLNSDNITIEKNYEVRTYSNSRNFIKKLLELFDKDNNFVIEKEDLREASEEDTKTLMEIVANSKNLIKQKLGDKFTQDLRNKAKLLKSHAIENTNINKCGFYNHKELGYSPLMITLVSLANPIKEYEYNTEENGIETMLDIMDKWFID